MKYLVMLCDGMADEPFEKLGNKTPMEVANKPMMDFLASKGEVGMVKTVAEGLKPGSDVANLSVLGYEPAVYYTGRSPLEAASIGIDLKETDVTLRCNLVTLSDEENYEDKTMVDYCGGDISTEEAKVLIDYIDEKLGNDIFKFYAGVQYRHCLVWANGDKDNVSFTPPHDISERVIKDYIPTGSKVEPLYDLMKKSYDLLKDHPLNQKRVAEGKRPANSIWLWGEGTKPVLDSFYNKFKKKGSMISAVDLLKGIAICADMDSIDVDGTTGYIDTNFEGKARAAVEELKNGCDLVYIHFEAPDECGHRNEPENKVKSIEMIDSRVLPIVLDALKEYDDYKIMVLPDHPTPIVTGTHASDPVPFMIYHKNDEKDSGVDSINEESAKTTGLFIEHGPDIMKRFLED